MYGIVLHPNSIFPPVHVAGIRRARRFAGQARKLLEQMRDVLRLKHYSVRTEQS
jgi:hypothetical protein